MALTIKSCSILLFIAGLSIVTPQALANWIAFLQSTAVCVDIPANLSLCQGIGYTKMRLPNLLNHDSLQEVSQQATSWVPLYQLACHPDTQLFLCSLFSPVCLDHPIPPCRSLCQTVRGSCEAVMLKYGYPWPKIVECDQFPIDNDMCIMAQHSTSASPSSAQSLAEKHADTGGNAGHGNKQRKGGHHKKNAAKKQRRYHQPDAAGLPPPQPPPAIQTTLFEPRPGNLQMSAQLDAERKLRQEPQVDQAVVSGGGGSGGGEPSVKQSVKWNKDQRQLYNDIISHYCRSQWIIKARIHPPNAQKLQIKVRKYLQIQGSLELYQKPLKINATILEQIRHSPLEHHSQQQQPRQSSTAGDERQTQARTRYLIMGRTDGEDNSVTFAMQWPHKSAQLRKAIKAIKKGNYTCDNSNNGNHSAGKDADRASGAATDQQMAGDNGHQPKVKPKSGRHRADDQQKPKGQNFWRKERPPARYKRGV